MSYVSPEAERVTGVSAWRWLAPDALDVLGEFLDERTLAEHRARADAAAERGEHVRRRLPDPRRRRPHPLGAAPQRGGAGRAVHADRVLAGRDREPLPRHGGGTARDRGRAGHEHRRGAVREPAGGADHGQAAGLLDAPGRAGRVPQPRASGRLSGAGRAAAVRADAVGRVPLDPAGRPHALAADRLGEAAGHRRAGAGAGVRRDRRDAGRGGAGPAAASLPDAGRAAAGGHLRDRRGGRAHLHQPADRADPGGDAGAADRHERGGTPGSRGRG